MTRTPPQPWEVVAEEQVLSRPPYIDARVQTVRLPDGRLIDDYHAVRMADHAVIFAKTAEGQVVAEYSYKHGPRQVAYSLPAGHIGPDEDPFETAKRELLEETGYTASRWWSLGQFTVNGNYGCGRAHFFAAEDAEWIAQPTNDDLEDIRVVLLTEAELLAKLATGAIATLSSATLVAMGTNMQLRQTCARPLTSP